MQTSLTGMRILYFHLNNLLGSSCSQYWTLQDLNFCFAEMLWILYIHPYNVYFYYSFKYSLVKFQINYLSLFTLLCQLFCADCLSALLSWKHPLFDSYIFSVTQRFYKNQVIGLTILNECVLPIKRTKFLNLLQRCDGFSN